jgi:hypothetical protein
METKSYLVALRSEKIGKISPGWAGQLGAIPGVEVQGATADQARILTDESGIKKVRSMLNADFLIEEEVRRYIPR